MHQVHTCWPRGNIAEIICLHAREHPFSIPNLLGLILKKPQNRIHGIIYLLIHTNELSRTVVVQILDPSQDLDVCVVYKHALEMNDRWLLYNRLRA